MGVIIPNLLTEDRVSGAQIVDGSLKFDSTKTQYLKRTPSSTGNRRTWTFSCWYRALKRGTGTYGYRAFFGSLNTYLNHAGAAGGATESDLYWNLRDAGTNYFGEFAELIRDPGAWYHIVWAVDTTQSTSSNRAKIYVNNVALGAAGAGPNGINYPPQNTDTPVNAASNVHYIGANDGAANPMEGQLAQFYFIDGQALDPSYFGFTDPLTNTWRPKKAKITLGSVWSNYFTGVGIIDDGALTNVFDGNTATQFEFNSTGGNGVFRPPNPISYTTSVELFSSRAFGGNTVSVNGGSTVSYGGNAWVTVASGPGTLTSLTFYNGTAGNQRIHAIRIDGNILTNTSGAIDAGQNGFYLPLDGNTPIGQDQSGRGNNWTPVNFGGSNTLEKATGALPILNTDGGGKVARVGVRTDSNASSLVLALPLVGIKSDFSNAINSGTSNKAVTANGNAAGITTISNFYGGSFYFDGTGDNIEVTASTDTNIGSGDFTVEGWVYNTRSQEQSYITNWNSGGQFQVQMSSTGTLQASWAPYSTGVYAITGSSAIPLNTWQHFAYVRNGSTFTLYLNGVSQGTLTSSATTSTNNSIKLGENGGNGDRDFQGYLQDIRIYKGVAKYTSNFIPASTDPDILPDTPSGVAYSSNVALVPSTDGAVAFDGSGDYLSLADSADFTFGTGDFTIEEYFYMPAGTTMLEYWRASLAVGGDSNTQNSATIYHTTSAGGSTSSVEGEISYIGPSNSYRIYSGRDERGKWTHVAVTRQSGTVRLFVDGTLRATQSDTTNYNATSGVTIGVSNVGNSNYFVGQISNVRVIKGTALYTSNFTPPTAPITSVANTKLLCCKSQTSATAADVTPGTITANGNAVATNFNPFTVNINTQRGQESGYATLNPLKNNSNNTLSDGNLKIVNSSSSTSFSFGNIVLPRSGKYYFEALASANGGDTNVQIGIFSTDHALTVSGSKRYWYLESGGLYDDGSLLQNVSTYGNGDLISVAYNADASTITWYKNGVQQGTAVSVSTSYDYVFGVGIYKGQWDVNFGQKPFKFPPPAGFQPLALANTPRPTIVRPDQYVGITTYNGNNSTNIIRAYNFKPDMVWLKARNNSGNGYDHIINDSVRGAGKNLVTNTRSGGASPGGEYQSSANTDFISFDNGGFTLGSVNQFNGINNANNIVAWAWKAGGFGGGLSYWKDDVGYATTTATGLTAGTIAPTGASVNTKSGFSIITYTGNGTNATIPHGLGRKPSLTIIKNLDDSSSWPVFTDIIDGSMDQLYLDTTDAKSDQSGLSALSTTTFSILSGSGSGASTKRYVAYIWAEIPGFSKFGSFTGSSSLPFIYTGFRPRWLLIKNAGASGDDWALLDSARNTYNEMNSKLWPNTSAVEATLSGNNSVDFLANGFKMRSDNNATNSVGNKMIYACFAEAPSFNLYGGQSNAR